MKSNDASQPEAHDEQPPFRSDAEAMRCKLTAVAATARNGRLSARSEAATNLLVFLHTIHDPSLCEVCTAAYLGLERLTALRAIRELILTTQILCSYRVCTLCRELGLCAKSDPNSLDTVFATTTMTAAKEVGHGRQAAEVHVSWQ
jgi:hypothetical protein